MKIFYITVLLCLQAFILSSQTITNYPNYLNVEDIAIYKDSIFITNDTTLLCLNTDGQIIKTYPNYFWNTSFRWYVGSRIAVNFKGIYVKNNNLYKLINNNWTQIDSSLDVAPIYSDNKDIIWTLHLEKKENSSLNNIYLISVDDILVKKYYWTQSDNAAHLQTINSDRDNNIGISGFWDVSGIGLFLFNGNSIKRQFECENVMDMQHEDDVIWLGTWYGLLKYSPYSEIEIYTINDGLVNDFIYSIAIDQDGTKYIGTKNGLSVFNGTNWYTLTTSDGLIDNEITRIKIDSQGNKWIVTPKGISKLHDFNPGPYIVKVINASVFMDMNGNGIKDNNEQNLKISKIYNLTDNELPYKNKNGESIFYKHAGQYQITYDLPQNWEATTGLIANANLVDNDTAIINFGIKPKSQFSDIVVDLTGERTRIGSNTRYWISYENIGTTIENGTVTYTLPQGLTFINSLPTPTSIVGNQLNWNFSNLEYFTKNSIAINASVNQEINNINKTIESSAIVTNSANLTFSDNLTQKIIGSYDPNDKLVTPANVITENTELEFTIRFQNTGNDTAYRVAIYDTISQNFDKNSIQIISSSHEVSLESHLKNAIAFVFDDINLVDSLHNEPESHGFVKYRIKPKLELPEGTDFYNQAYIYFDQNPPVITNKTHNFYLHTNIQKLEKTNVINLYPNPTDDLSIIELPIKDGRLYTLFVLNQLGEIVCQKSSNNQIKDFVVDSKDLKINGVYIIKLLDEYNNTYIGKLIFNKKN